MSELIEEYIEPKTHSIVTCAAGDEKGCLLRANHKGQLVTYQGVTGWLIRYVTDCRHHLLALSLTEAKECLELNRPAEVIE